MNLWVKKLGLISGLALLFFSCEDPEEIGLELNPDAGKFKSAYAEIPVQVGQIQAEPYFVTDTVTSADISNQTFPSLSKLIIGRSVDQDFGTTKATAFTQVELTGDSIVINEDATLATIELKLLVNDIYGQSPTFGEEQIFYVHELNEEIDDISTSDDQYQMSSQPLAQFSINSDSAIMDTVVYVTLPDSLGQRFIDNAKDESNGHFRNNENFTKFFKGLAIVPDENNTLLMEVSPGSQNSYLRLGYDDSEGGDSLYFNMANANRSNYIESDRTGTPISNINSTNEPDFSLDKLYLKAGLGLMGYVNINDIYNIKDTAQGFVVNRAELVIDEELDFDTLKWVPTSLSVYLARDDFNFKNLSLPWRVSSFYSYQFNASDTTRAINHYLTPSSVNLAAYFNSMVATQEEPALYITPSPYATSVAQTILDKKNLKLRLYFSYLK